MINEEVLSEKLKYLIIMNAKPKMFEIMNVYIEFDYIDQNHTKLANYDVDVKFDYNGFATEPLVFNIEYEADTKHIFDLGYKFNYSQD